MKLSGNHLTFTSYTEAIGYAERMKDGSPSAVCMRNSTRDFTGTASYTEAHTLATRGWAEGRKAVAAMSARIVLPGTVVKPEPYMDVVGDGGIDIGAACIGLPECMHAWRESEQTDKRQRGPVIRIAFNPAVSGGIDAETVILRGAAVAALVDALEEGGRRVELVIEKINHNDSTGTDFQITIPLKAADSAAQPDQIAFALLHPSMNRRILFSLTAQCGPAGRSAARGSYGSASKLVPTDADLFIPRLDYTNARSFSNVHEAHAWVLARLADFGVTVEEGQS
jgi:hypothetical protein